MNEQPILRQQILVVLHETTGTVPPWSSEYDIEDVFAEKGYDVELVKDQIDQLIEEGTLEFVIDPLVGGYLLAPTFSSQRCG